MLYLYVPRENQDEAYQNDQPPNDNDIKLIVNSQLDVYRYNDEIERMEQYQPKTNTYDGDDWDEIQFQVKQ